MISDIVSNRDTHVNKYTVYLKPVINTCITRYSNSNRTYYEMI